MSAYELILAALVAVIVPSTAIMGYATLTTIKGGDTDARQ